VRSLLGPARRLLFRESLFVFPPTTVLPEVNGQVPDFLRLGPERPLSLFNLGWGSLTFSLLSKIRPCRQIFVLPFRSSTPGEQRFPMGFSVTTLRAELNH